MAQNERLKNSISEYDIAFYLQRVSLPIILIFRKNSGTIFLYEEFLANQKRLEAIFACFQEILNSQSAIFVVKDGRCLQ